MERTEYISKGPSDTIAIGERIGSAAKPGQLYAIYGGLGAGKTQLVKGMARGIGVPDWEYVVSPTFTLMNVYQGREQELRHFDLYRLNRPEELEDIGFGEYAGGEGITLIEWAELFPDALPEEYLQLTLSIVPEGRKITLAPRGKRYEELLAEITKEGQPTC